MLYDPPSGWKYGFPKEYKPLPEESIEDTLLRDGYPQEEINWGGAKHCRFIGVDNCKHDQGFWFLTEHYENAGNWCCLGGCGFILPFNPDEYKDDVNAS